MPPGDYEDDRLIVKKVQEGKLDESVVDQACERILNIIFRYTENRDEKAVFDYEKIIKQRLKSKRSAWYY